MEKVLNDPATGIKPGRFPKPEVTITRAYQCESPRIVADTTQIDSALLDSTLTIPLEENQPAEQEKENPNPTIIKILADVKSEPKKPVKKDN